MHQGPAVRGILAGLQHLASASIEEILGISACVQLIVFDGQCADLTANNGDNMSLEEVVEPFFRIWNALVVDITFQKEKNARHLLPAVPHCPQPTAFPQAPQPSFPYQQPAAYLPPAPMQSYPPHNRGPGTKVEACFFWDGARCNRNDASRANPMACKFNMHHRPNVDTRQAVPRKPFRPRY